MATNASTPAAGLQITDTKIGTGFTPKPGQTCIVHYTGWIYENGAKGKKFDSSVDRKTPFSFVLGEHKVIEGWERGVSTMKVGGKRTLIIPPSLAYGSAGGGAAIPSDSSADPSAPRPCSHRGPALSNNRRSARCGRPRCS